MNERIKSLLVECGAELVKGTHNGRTGTAVNLPVGRMFDFEKFAELIVRECARVALEKQTENDIANIVSENPAKDFAYALIEHFGVEE